MQVGSPTAFPKVFFCIGAQKAGTTWLYDYLRSHPDFHVPLCKELHYFDIITEPRNVEYLEKRQRRIRRKNWIFGLGDALARLKNAFANGQGKRPSPGEFNHDLLAMYEDDSGTHEMYRRVLLYGYAGQAYTVDITPSYAAQGEAGIREMLSAFPDAKFLFILRDPVSRIWSALRMRARKLSSPLHRITPESLLETYLAGGEEGVQRRTEYGETVAALDKLVPEDQRLYLFYETMFTDGSIRRLNEFLGVTYHPAEVEKKVHTTRPARLPEAKRNAIRARVAHVYDAMVERFGETLPDKWLPTRSATDRQVAAPAMVEAK